jgi:hypothetical protein
MTARLKRLRKSREPLEKQPPGLKPEIISVMFKRVKNPLKRTKVRGYTPDQSFYADCLVIGSPY